MLRAVRASIARHRVGLLVAVGCVALIVGGLVAEGFLSTPPGSAAPIPRVHTAAPLATGPSSSRTATAHGRKRTAPPGTPAERRQALAQLPQAGPHRIYNPLNHLDGSVHIVTVRVTSTGPIGKVGYLVPTGLSAPQGEPTVHGSSWSLRQLALGSGKLAAIFVQTDATGRRMTCSVTVDGKTTVRETVDRPYARTVCLG